MNLIISGTKKDFEGTMNRLISKYGKEAKLIDVINKEKETYEIKGDLILK